MQEEDLATLELFRHIPLTFSERQRPRHRLVEWKPRRAGRSVTSPDVAGLAGSTAGHPMLVKAGLNLTSPLSITTQIHRETRRLDVLELPGFGRPTLLVVG